MVSHDYCERRDRAAPLLTEPLFLLIIMGDWTRVAPLETEPGVANLPCITPLFSGLGDRATNCDTVV